MPERTVRMPSRTCVPKAEWIAIDAGRAPSIRRTLRAKTTSTATTTHAHQRWRKWRRYGPWIPIAVQLSQVERRPDEGAEQEEREEKVGGKSIRADLGTAFEP